MDENSQESSFFVLHFEAAQSPGDEHFQGKDQRPGSATCHRLTMAEVEDGRDRFLRGAENALRSRPRNEEALKD